MFINLKNLGALVLAGFLTYPNISLAAHGNCPDLHAAAFLDEPDELTALLDDGVDLNCLDQFNQTPLITATEGASLEIVKMLLGQGVLLNERDELGQTALSKARQKLAFFDMQGGGGYRQLYREMIDLLEKAGAVE